MKKIAIVFFLIFAVVFSSAQNLYRTKEETLQLISDLYKSSYKYWDENGEEIFVVSVTLENGKLVKRYTSGSDSITDLIANEPIEIREYLTSYGFRIIYSNESYKALLGNISTKNDAILLKKYLENLIFVIFNKKEQ